MFTKYISVIILSFLCAFSISQLSAQEKKEAHKVVVIEKSIDENGNVTENKVVKEGEEAKEYLKDMEIDIEEENVWITDEEEEIDLSGKKAKMIKKKKMRISVQDAENGEERIIVWDGEGEMPEEMKTYAEEFGLLKDMSNEAVEEEIEVTVNSFGDEEKSVIKIVSDSNGEKEEIEIELEGDDLSDEVKQMLKEKGINLKLEELEGDGDHRVMVFVEDEETKDLPSNKAQLGVFLGGDENGVLIEEIVPESSAAEAGLLAGDVITTFGNKKVTSVENLVSVVGEYAPGDKVTVGFIRDKKNMSKEVTLKESKNMEAILDKQWQEKYQFKSNDSLEEHEENSKNKKQIKKKIIIKKD